MLRKDAHGFAKEICCLRSANPAQQTSKVKITLSFAINIYDYAAAGFSGLRLCYDHPISEKSHIFLFLLARKTNYKKSEP